MRFPQRLVKVESSRWGLREEFNMMKNRSVSLLLLILCAGIVLGVLINNNFTLKTVEAQQNQTAKWEYCRVSEYVKNYDKSGQVVFSAYIEYYQPTGVTTPPAKEKRLLWSVHKAHQNS